MTKAEVGQAAEGRHDGHRRAFTSSLTHCAYSQVPEGRGPACSLGSDGRWSRQAFSSWCAAQPSQGGPGARPRHVAGIISLNLKAAL